MARYSKIILSVFLSFFISFFLIRNLFVASTPEPDWLTLKNNFNTAITQSKNLFAQKNHQEIVDLDQILPTATIYPSPKPSPSKLSPTISFARRITSPTIKPYMSPTRKPLPSPTRKPTIKPTTPTPSPLPFYTANPLTQPYYQLSQAYKCYSQEKFIEFFANNAPIDKCFASVEKEIKANLTTVKIFDKNISVHKTAYPAFAQVSQEIDKYRIGQGLYQFPSKKYQIDLVNTYGYNFRCNVNQTKEGDPYDPCNPTCILSPHAFGIAVDINPNSNPNGSLNYDIPDEMIAIFERYGFRWGGRYKQIFKATNDPMHFEYLFDICKNIK